MDLWWCLIAKNNYMFRPTAAVFRLLQFFSRARNKNPREQKDNHFQYTPNAPSHARARARTRTHTMETWGQKNTHREQQPRREPRRRQTHKPTNHAPPNPIEYHRQHKFFFRKSCRLCDNVEKYCTEGQDTHWECVTLTAFPLQQWLQERPSMLSLDFQCLSCYHFPILRFITLTISPGQLLFIVFMGV